MDEDGVAPEWVLLSEIEHWAYCRRQWAIIHLEQRFADNELTTRGHLAHETVDRSAREQRRERLTRWALDVWSDALRIRGRCDRVVWEGDAVVPIEHKSGRRAMQSAMLQLAGQAMCLEEMLGGPVPHGRLYLVASKEMRDVVIDASLRAGVISAAEEIRTWRATGSSLLPSPANDQRCPTCSLQESCMPALVGSPNQVRGLHGATWWP